MLAGEDRVSFVIQNTHLLGLLDFVHAGPVWPNVEDAECDRNAEDSREGAGTQSFHIKISFQLLGSFFAKQPEADNDDIHKN
ncbi:hypothetical protein D3C81_2093620 [compost metagenome]